MNKQVIKYISIKHVINSYADSDSFDVDTYSEVKKYLVNIDLNNKRLIIFDFNNVQFWPIVKTKSSSLNKSILYYAFNDLFSKMPEVTFLFINVNSEFANYLKEKDFPGSKNIYMHSFNPDFLFDNCGGNEECKPKNIEKRFLMFDDLTFLNKKDLFIKVIESLIGENVYELLRKYDCITNTTKDNHILSSTPVHVNKYINIKPIIENYQAFTETCSYLAARIKTKMGSQIDFLVAPSRNAISIASGLMKFLRKTDIIIIDNVSPITAYGNYSNVSDILSMGRYAIIEDFHCMGTEVKTVKGILWSRGVNVDENVYSFPISATSIMDKEDHGGFEKQKIFPLYELAEEINYRIFSKSSCPYCNNIVCEHRKLFLM